MSLCSFSWFVPKHILKCMWTGTIRASNNYINTSSTQWYITNTYVPNLFMYLTQWRVFKIEFFGDIFLKFLFAGNLHIRYTSTPTTVRAFCNTVTFLPNTYCTHLIAHTRYDNAVANKRSRLTSNVFSNWLRPRSVWVRKHAHVTHVSRGQEPWHRPQENHMMKETCGTNLIQIFS